MSSSDLSFALSIVQAVALAIAFYGLRRRIKELEKRKDVDR